MNIFSVIANFQDAALKARATAFLADEFHVGEKLHFDGDGAVALAGFAAAARHVKGKMAGGVTATLRIWRIGKNFANRVESFEVSGRIRARRAADRRLIDDDYLADVGIAFQPVAEFLDAAADPLCGECFVQHVMNESGLAGPADARNYRERSEWNHQIQILKVVHAGAVETEKFAGRFVAHVGHGNAQLAAEVAARERFMFLEHR